MDALLWVKANSQLTIFLAGVAFYLLVTLLCAVRGVDAGLPPGHDDEFNDWSPNRIGGDRIEIPPATAEEIAESSWTG